MNGTIEPIVGRYVHVDIGGVMHRIYFEENGVGIPLVCLHTAGSDNRQWRHLLCDEELNTTGSSPSTCPGMASRTRPMTRVAASIN
jgi:hypothetical protein